MNATAASTAMISQRDGCPTSDAPAATSRPPIAVFAIALPHRRPQSADICRLR